MRMWERVGLLGDVLSTVHGVGLVLAALAWIVGMGRETKRAVNPHG